MALRNRFRCATGLYISVIATLAMAQTSVDREIVPSGKLRVGINGANATLYARAADGSASDVDRLHGEFLRGVTHDGRIVLDAAKVLTHPGLVVYDAATD